jgi:hypothetical protein
MSDLVLGFFLGSGFSGAYFFLGILSEWISAKRQERKSAFILDAKYSRCYFRFDPDQSEEQQRLFVRQTLDFIEKGGLSKAQALKNEGPGDE